MADVAQLVESQIVILVVAGSSPVVRPIKHKDFLSISIKIISFYMKFGIFLRVSCLLTSLFWHLKFVRRFSR